MIRFGLQIPRVADSARAGSAYLGHILERFCTVAEQAGFDSLWTGDHLLHTRAGDVDPVPEAFTLLGAIAAHTGHVRLGALVAAVTLRNPAVLAKVVSTLDLLSGGRAVMGLGAAWNADEHHRYGVPFPSLRVRMELLEDALGISRAMFTQQSPTYHGHHHSIEGALNHPRPLRGSIPILVGGNGERRTLRLAATYADACNLTVADPRQIRHKLAVLGQHCEALGRDPATIAKTRGGGLVLDTSAERARTRAEELRALLGLDAERFANWAYVGTPDHVCELIQRGFDAGIDGMMFYIPDAPDGEPIALAGRMLRQAFG